MITCRIGSVASVEACFSSLGLAEGILHGQQTRTELGSLLELWISIEKFAVTQDGAYAEVSAQALLAEPPRANVTALHYSSILNLRNSICKKIIPN